MKKNAEKCGFFSTGLNEKVCECSGNMVNDNSPLNPLLKGTGGVNYYCYGECSECKCYSYNNLREWRNGIKTEIDCLESVTK